MHPVFVAKCKSPRDLHRFTLVSLCLYESWERNFGKINNANINFISSKKREGKHKTRNFIAKRHIYIYISIFFKIKS